MGQSCRLVGRKPALLKAKITDEIEHRCSVPANGEDHCGRKRSIASSIPEVVERIVPSASGFEIQLPSSKDPWDGLASRVALVSGATILIVTFKDLD